MATPFRWADGASYHLDEANLNKHCDASSVNLVRNGGFDIWDDGDTLPSLWDKVGTCAISKNTSATYIKYGTASTKISAPSTSNCGIKYDLDEQGIYYFRGQTVTFSGWLHCNNTARSVKVYIYDSVSATTYSSAHATQGGWEKLSVTATIHGNAGSAMVGIVIENTGALDLYADNMMLNIGEIALPFVPHHSDFPVVGATHDTDRYPCGVVWNPYGDKVLGINNGGGGDWTAVDVPSVTTNWCLDRTEAILCKVRIWDSSFALPDKWSAIRFREKGDSDVDNEIRLVVQSDYQGEAMNTQDHMIWIGLDSGGEFEYVIVTGSTHPDNTFNCEVFPMAYLIPL